MEGYHRSVLLREIIEALRVEKDKWYLDCTLGDGGDSLEVLKLGGRVVGFDVDPQALERVEKRFEEEGVGKDRFKLIRGNFRDIKNLIQQAGLADQKFKGVIFDLGVSSLQLMDPERGFSFAEDGPLDMRMDPSLGIKAWDLINALTRKELYELFKTLGEEKYSWDLATACKRASEIGIINTTIDLARIIERVVGSRKGKIPARHALRSDVGRHPATQAFQALRIAVNDELGALREGLDQALDLIEKNGCICATSFHSLEDRIIKNTFKRFEGEGKGEIITDKPVMPSDEELQQNPRSRSGKLRIFKVS